MTTEDSLLTLLENARLAAMRARVAEGESPEDLPREIRRVEYLIAAERYHEIFAEGLFRWMVRLVSSSPSLEVLPGGSSGV